MRPFTPPEGCAAAARGADYRSIWMCSTSVNSTPRPLARVLLFLHVQDQTADAVRRHVPVLAVDDRQRAVGETRVGLVRCRSGGLRVLRGLPCARAPRRRRRPGGARRTGRGGRSGGAGRGAVSGRRVRRLGRRVRGAQAVLPGPGREQSRLSWEWPCPGRAPRCRHQRGKGELPEQSGVRVTLGRPRLGPARLPAADGGPPHREGFGHLVQGQAMRVAQPLALCRRRQRGPGRDQCATVT